MEIVANAQAIVFTLGVKTTNVVKQLTEGDAVAVYEDERDPENRHRRPHSGEGAEDERGFRKAEGADHRYPEEGNLQQGKCERTGGPSGGSAESGRV